MVGQIQLAHHAREHGFLIGVVVNDEVPLQPDFFGIAPQKLRTHRVKGADPQIARDLRARERREAGLHLARRFVRERDGQNAVWRDARSQQIGDAVNDRARLAAAGARENEQRPFGMGHRLHLGFVQLGHGTDLANLAPAHAQDKSALGRIALPSRHARLLASAHD